MVILKTLLAFASWGLCMGEPERWIVQFGQYARISEWEDVVATHLRKHMESAHCSQDHECIVSNSTAWSFGDRSKEARDAPSDFVVVLARDRGRAAHAGPEATVASHLPRVPGARHVFRDSQVTQRPLGGGLRGPASRSLQGEQSVTDALRAPELWARGITGKGVRVAVFDTGLRAGHPHFRNVEERSNWTAEKSLDDGHGHGTFVAGLIASAHAACPGFAPDATLLIFRVFTSAEASYTSWFLDAFNYALHRDVDVLNLSIGGPDFNDRPFRDKAAELTASGIVLVSAMGNDGPLYGTLMNPADQSDVIGVGGLTWGNEIAPFSSRGMTTWEIPTGYGRVKPDVVTYADHLVSSARGGSGCTSLSGTSVASPVVAGAVALLASSLTPAQRAERLNPAVIKQVLIETADRLDTAGHVFEQGAGRLNLVKAVDALAAYTPRPSFHPATLDLTDCPYMWPHCSQPLFAHAEPVMFNVTLLNGMGVSGAIEGRPRWEPRSNGHVLNVSATFSRHLWPWSGHLSLRLRVAPTFAGWSGVAEGEVVLAVRAERRPGETAGRLAEVRLPVRAEVVPTPPRERRVLWDVWHGLRYPTPFLPRDNLHEMTDILDWHGDHPHTNLHGLWDALRAAGFFVDILTTDLTCDPGRLSRYGTFLSIDAEEEVFPEEVSVLAKAVEAGLGVVVLADWYDAALIDAVRFFDDNTRTWWDAVTGGANVPALNDLLRPFGVGFGDRVFTGDATVAGHAIRFPTGTTIQRAPRGVRLDIATLRDHSATASRHRGVARQLAVPVLAALDGATVRRGLASWRAAGADDGGGGGSGSDGADDLSGSEETTAGDAAASRMLLQGLRASARPEGGAVRADQADGAGEMGGAREPRTGRVVAFGDSNCVDTAQQVGDCYDLVTDLLSWASGQPVAGIDSLPVQSEDFAAVESAARAPDRHRPELLRPHSKVTGEGRFAGESCAAQRIPEQL